MDVTFEGKTETGKSEWLTPPILLHSLGSFDLDPCASVNQPWNTAKKHYTVKDNGLEKQWKGSVWCNPPYGNQTVKWLNKCSQHKNCIALVFARTETKMFFSSVWEKATAILFIEGRLKFYDIDGIKQNSAGAPSVLIAYNKTMAKRLEKSGVKGKLIWLK